MNKIYAAFFKKSIWLSVLIISYLAVCMPCKGQIKSDSLRYTERAEYGLAGPVKNVTTFQIPVIDDKIPKDTLGYELKLFTKYSVKGNLEFRKTTFISDGAETTYYITLSGEDKNRIMTEKVNQNTDSLRTTSYNIIWLDKYHYNFINKDVQSSGYSYFFTLDKNFLITKTVVKNSDFNYEENRTLQKKKGIIEKESTIKTYTDSAGKTTSTLLDIPQKTDRYGNALITYSYLNGTLKNVLVRAYQYY